MAVNEGEHDVFGMIGEHTVVWRGQTAFFDVCIVESPSLGRALFLDEVLQSTTLDEAEYHEALVGPAMRRFGAELPRDVLILGAGEGATTRDVLRRESVERVVAVDLDGELMDVVREHLFELHEGALDDPRVELRIEDARDTLRRAGEGSFDLIIVDLTDPPDASLGPTPEVAPVLDLEFIRGLRAVLREGGIVSVQAGESNPPSAASVYSPLPALREVFGQVEVEHRWIEAFNMDWTFALAMG